MDADVRDKDGRPGGSTTELTSRRSQASERFCGRKGGEMHSRPFDEFAAAAPVRDRCFQFFAACVQALVLPDRITLLQTDDMKKKERTR